MKPDLSTVLAQLAEKLGTSVEHLWPILVARERVAALLTIIFLGFMFVLGLLGWGFWTRSVRQREAKGVPVGDAWFGIVGAAIWLVVILIAMCCNTINYLFPEISALKTILTMLK